jgi:uncharacterized protein (DUF433 family)
VSLVNHQPIATASSTATIPPFDYLFRAMTGRSGTGSHRTAVIYKLSSTTLRYFSREPSGGSGEVVAASSRTSDVDIADDTVAVCTPRAAFEPRVLAERIQKTDGVVGGSARIAGTRIPVWTIESYRRLGAADAQIMDAFPTLQAIDLRAATAYSAANRAEINREIAENEEG